MPQLPPPLPLPPPTFCTTGTGNSPPARKLAVSPDSAISVGSASVVIAPFFSSASSVTLKFSPNARKAREMIPKLSMIAPMPEDADLPLSSPAVRLAPPPIDAAASLPWSLQSPS